MNKKPFDYAIGKAHEGKYTIISLFSRPADIHKKSLMVQIAPELGSNMFAMRWGKNDIIYHEPDVLLKRGFTGNFVLFPTPNRVKKFTYIWNGKTITMEKRGSTVEIHGLVFDEAWDYKKPVIRPDSVAVQTQLTIDEKSPLFEAFPFPCTLTLEYILYADTIRIMYTVKNLGKTALPFGFGLHPYFNRLSGDMKTTITIPAESWMESPKDTLLPTGKLIPVMGKPYDVRTPKPVGELTLDHVYTNLQKGSFATVDYPTQGFKVRLKPTEDFTHMVVYTGHPEAVCIENQTCSTDAHNLWDRGLHEESHLIVITPGQSHTGHVDYVIEESSGVSPVAVAL